MQNIGIDIGSQKTILVNQEADILLTDTGWHCFLNIMHHNFDFLHPKYSIGSVTRPTLISFLGRNRLLGEEAAPQIFSENTISAFNLLLGKTLSEIQTSPLFPHRKTQFSQEDEVMASVAYCGEQSSFSLNALVAMYIAKLIDRIIEVHGNNYKIAFAIPPTASHAYIQALRDACTIAHVDPTLISLYSAADCLVATYGRKISGLRPPERAALEGKNILLLDVGHTSTLAVIVQAYEPVKGGNDGKGPKKLSEAFHDTIGGAIFDLKMFEHFSSVCQTKHNTSVSIII